MDDRELLAAYVRDGSEAAFGELVRRHVAWVYSVALRHVGDPTLAEDVTQSVFVLLAQKAARLHSETIPGGWIFQTTRFVANRALRAEKRRRHREKTAASMISTTISSDENLAVWKALEPHLEDAVDSLSPTDRQAILLRFYQKKSLLEVGRSLGASEEAAKKRVSRAIQKMRDFLLGRGVTVGAAVLAGIMAEHTVQAVPPALVTSIGKTTLANVSGSFPPLAQDTLNVWRWATFRILGGLTGALCALAWFAFVLLTRSPATTHSEQADPGQAHGQPTPLTAAVFAAAQANNPARNNERVLLFRVLAKDSDEPVRGVRLAVNTVNHEGWKQRFDLSTDETGRATISYPVTTTRLDVGSVGSGWVARFATWWTELDGQIPSEYTLRVQRQTNLMGGWLKTPQGEPVANAVVVMEFGASDMAQEENPRERPGFVTSAPVARTDRNGWWSCAVVDPNATRIPGLRARHPRFAATQIVVAHLAHRDRAQTESMKLLWGGALVTIMNQGVPLKGRVITEDGGFVGGALIEHEPGTFEPIAAETDSQGWFAVPGLPTGDFDFTVTAPGFAQSCVKVNVTEGMEPVQVRLKPGGILRLLLVDENENALENVSVALTGPGGAYMPGMNWSARSGPDGKVEWTSANPDSVLTICASRPPDYAMSRVSVKADGKEHVIRLGRRFVVGGRVIDARTGELVRGEVKAFPGYGNGMDSWYRGETRRSTDGTFRVYFDGGDWPWRFRVEADGYSPFVSEVPPSAASSSVTDVYLESVDPTKTVRGTIFRTDGQPAAGVEVALLTAEHGAFLGRGRLARRAAVDRLIVDTDETGQFSFPEEPHAALVIAVSSNGFARVPVGDLTTPMKIPLRPWSRMEGSIQASARSRPVDRVIVDDLLAMDAPGCLRLEREEFDSKPTEDGRFSFDFVPPGLLCVWLSLGSHEGAPNLPPFHHPVWVSVMPGETSTVEVADAWHRVKGRLVLDGHAANALNAPAFAVLVPAESRNSTERNSQRWMQSFFDPGRLIIEPDGRFESWDSIRPGTYRLRGRLAGIHLDQLVEVPDPPSSAFSSGGVVVDPPEPDFIELGDVLISPPSIPSANPQ